jgi:hypothetical protein
MNPSERKPTQTHMEAKLMRRNGNCAGRARIHLLLPPLRPILVYRFASLAPHPKEMQVIERKLAINLALQTYISKSWYLQNIRTCPSNPKFCINYNVAQLDQFCLQGKIKYAKSLYTKKIIKLFSIKEHETVAEYFHIFTVREHLFLDQGSHLLPQQSFQLSS